MKPPGAPVIDLTGKVFHQWTVLSQAPKGPPPSQTRWRCRCSCGTIRESVAYCSLTSGRSRSCGCARFKKAAWMKAHTKPVRRHTNYPWRGTLMKLTEIARMENVDAMELRRLVVVKGMTLGDAVIELATRGRTFHERAASHGATGGTRTGRKRVRRVVRGTFVHLLPEIVHTPPPDPLADIW